MELSINEIAAKRLSLSDDQIRILKYVEGNSPTLLENLYKALDINKKTAAYNFAKLEKIGLVRTIPTSDGRMKPKILTPLGVEILKFKQTESDNKQAWDDPIRRTQDKDEDARKNFTVFKEFKANFEKNILISLDDKPSVDAAKDLISVNKQKAWDDLIRLTQDGNAYARWNAADALGATFQHVPDKQKAWDDLQRLIQDEKTYFRKGAADALGVAFQYVPDKQKAWNDLIRLTQYEKAYLHKSAADALGVAFQYVPDKQKAWEDLHRLTQDKDEDVRKSVAYSLGAVFQHIPDKQGAWNDLIRLTQDGNAYARWNAADALEATFQHVPDKQKAWDDLIRLTQDKDERVRWSTTLSLVATFQHVPDKQKAWNDLIRLTQDKNEDVRWSAANALGAIFQHVPDKQKAWTNLIRLTQDKDDSVRKSVAYSLGSIFQHVPDKQKAWEDLHRLTQDNHRDMRMSANHSLGKASIFKAVEAKSEESFKKELEKAIEFFEGASKESTHYDNPASFCLPFYKSFYTITFRKQGAEDEVKKYLAEAKSAVERSESKEKLLEAVENLANALTETQKAMEMNLEGKKCELDAYRRYCDRTAELLGTTEKNAPGATKLIRKGLPIIDEKIKGIIAEIQKKTKSLCIKTKDTSFEELGKEVYHIGQTFSQIRDPVELEKSMKNMQIALSAICAKMPDNERVDACELLKKVNDEQFVEDKLSLINMFLSRIPYQLGKKEMHRGSSSNE